MRNILTLVRGPDWTLNGHGGRKVYRTFKLYLNGTMIEDWREGSANSFNYYIGHGFDRGMNARVRVLETACGTRCNRVTLKPDARA